MTVGVAGAWCPSRSSRDRRANPCPPGTSLNPLGGGCLGVGVCAASSPGLHPSGTRASCCCATAALGLEKRATRSSRALLSEGPVPVERRELGPHTGWMDPRASGPFPQGSLKLPPLLAWGSRQHFLQEALTDFPCLSASTALHGGSEFPLLLACLSPTFS